MITFAAVWHEGHLFTGKRHHDCIAAASILVRGGIGKFPVSGAQGFLTDNLRYLSRADAAKHALKCKQVTVGKANITHVFDGKTLYSEDLW